MDRATLEQRYLELVRDRLPAQAAAAGDWPIRFDHCFMRVVLDHVFGQCWYDAINRKKGPAYRQMSDEQLRCAIDLAEHIERGGRATLEPMNQQSLRWRGKL